MKVFESDNFIPLLVAHAIRCNVTSIRCQTAGKCQIGKITDVTQLDGN